MDFNDECYTFNIRNTITMYRNTSEDISGKIFLETKKRPIYIISETEKDEEN
jgi:hypothetical protein